jgi:hypothetical protein
MPKQRHEAGDEPARLTLTIGSTAYDVRITRGRIVLHGHDRGQRYDVTTPDGAVECTCPDYGHRGKPEGRPCKHARALISLGLITLPEAPDAEEPQD